jgi:hypothetical protein
MSDSRTGPERLREIDLRDDSVDQPEDSGRRSILGWQTVPSLLLIISGVLFAASSLLTGALVIHFLGIDLKPATADNRE